MLIFHLHFIWLTFSTACPHGHHPAEINWRKHQWTHSAVKLHLLNQQQQQDNYGIICYKIHRPWIQSCVLPHQLMIRENAIVSSSCRQSETVSQQTWSHVISCLVSVTGPLTSSRGIRVNSFCSSCLASSGTWHEHNTAVSTILSATPIIVSNIEGLSNSWNFGTSNTSEITSSGAVRQFQCPWTGNTLNLP